MGKVAAPGVHAVPVGARLTDVLAAAGGALPGVDLTSLDLARRVQDGEQIRVGLPGAPAAPPSGGGSAAPSGTPGPDNPVDLNAASADELDALPGVGPTTAGRIVAWRDAHGPFASVASLAQVPGISARRLSTLSPLLRV